MQKNDELMDKIEGIVRRYYSGDDEIRAVAMIEAIDLYNDLVERGIWDYAPAEDDGDLICYFEDVVDESITEIKLKEVK